MNDEPISDKEAWRQVKGWPLYEVSDLGRVRSIQRPARFGGNINRSYGGSVLKNVKASTGYAVVMLRETGKRRKQELVHRLVLETFIGDAPVGCEACHNNGDRMDARLSNLRWDSRRNNIGDKRIHGTMARGERIGSAKLSEDQVRQIRASTLTQYQLADEFGLSQSSISAIIRRKTWAHI